jgi:hypothetical protein
MIHARLARIAAITIAILASVIAANAQPGVTVQLFQPPPNQLKIADFWRIRLTNSSNTTYTVCLFGTLDETNIGKRLVEATTARFTLPPGTKLITGADIQPIDAEYFDNRYKDVFLRTGSAPAGEYRICVEVRLECGPQVLATDCKQVIVQPVTPPILISPPNESNVEDRLPMFSWMPPSPLKSGQRPMYTVKIVEVLGRQTPYDAMQSNPAWFERNRITPTVFQYPISSRALTPNSRYAWRVTAADGDFPLGESEIWWFTYTPRKNEGLGDDRSGDPTGKPTGGKLTGTGISTRGTNLFLDSAAHRRGVAVQTFATDAGRIRPLTGIEFDRVADKVKFIVPPALLKELLRSCQGE